MSTYNGENQHDAAEFKYKRGDIVNYHPIIDEESDGESYEVIDFWKLGHGEKVYKLVGKSGCVSEDALSISIHCKPSVCVRMA